MRELLFLLSVIGFIWAFIKVEIYLFKKSREKFLELKQAYKELKDAEQDLHNLLQDKKL